MGSIRFKLENLVLLALIPACLVFYLPSMSGVVFFIALSFIAISFLFFLKYLGVFFPYFEQKKSFLNNVLLVVASIMVSLILIESLLGICQSKQQITQKIVMPKEWKKKGVKIPGASYAYYWHNILHVHDRNHMRRTSPVPPKSKKRFRIVVVGDSLTYGYGVSEEQTYPGQIESILKKNFNVEVLNLGISGYQSEDVLRIVREYAHFLQPDLIIYGVCLNDFLPSGVGQYENNMAYCFPLPGAIKRFLLERTHLGQMVNEAYNKVLMRLGLRNDFYTDILKDFKNYQTRFARDARNMNLFVLNMGLPPIVAMVLNQFPKLDSKGYQIAMAAERHLTNAGMIVVPTDEFYKKYDKQQMVVSPWEGHPSAEAHKVFADCFVSHLEHRQELNPYRIEK